MNRRPGISPPHSPKDLDYDTLRGHQKYRNVDTPENCIGILKDQFGWHGEQVLTAMWKVTYTLAQNAPGEISELLSRLPGKWQAILIRHRNRNKADPLG